MLIMSTNRANSTSHFRSAAVAPDGCTLFLSLVPLQHIVTSVTSMIFIIIVSSDRKATFGIGHLLENIIWLYRGTDGFTLFPALVPLQHIVTSVTSIVIIKYYKMFHSVSHCIYFPWPIYSCHWVISDQLSVISYQLPVISYQLSVTSYQLPVTSYQLLVTSY